MSKPGSSFKPPRLGKHQGLVVTSTIRAGSQKPTARPMRGIGVPQAQIGKSGLLVSGRPGQSFAPPSEIGKMQLQQISVTGLTNLPVHFDGGV